MPQLDPIASDYPFVSQYAEVLGSQMHYVEVGEGQPALFVHGNPTWSYLWRNILPRTKSAGRCIAVDLIGMGRSDKPAIDYSLADHCRYLDAFIEALGLEQVALVMHDWGTALGLSYGRRHEANVRGVAFMEGVVRPVASWDDLPADMAKLFQRLRTREEGWNLIVEQNYFIERILPASIKRKLTEGEMAAYREPFAEEASRKPVWRWPNEIPIAGEPAEAHTIVAANAEWLEAATLLPKLLLYAQPGILMTAPVVAWCREHLSALATVDVGAGLHFVQEDQPEVIGRALELWLHALPKAA